MGQLICWIFHLKNEFTFKTILLEINTVIMFCNTSELYFLNLFMSHIEIVFLMRAYYACYTAATLGNTSCKMFMVCHLPIFHNSFTLHTHKFIHKYSLNECVVIYIYYIDRCGSHLDNNVVLSTNIA